MGKALQRFACDACGATQQVTRDLKYSPVPAVRCPVCRHVFLREDIHPSRSTSQRPAPQTQRIDY